MFIINWRIILMINQTKLKWNEQTQENNIQLGGETV